MVARSFAILLALLFSCTLATPQAHALSVPGLKSEKEKKKEEEKKRLEEEAKKAAAQKSGDEKKEEPKAAETHPAVAAPAADAPAPSAVVAQTTSSEVTLSKEGFDAFKEQKVGAFVEYSMPAQPGSKMRYEVTEKTDASITVAMSSSGTGYQMKTVTKYVVKDEQAKVSAANKEFNCAVTEVKSGGQVQSRSFTSKEIPQLMGGIVKIDGPDGKPTMVLSDFSAGK